MRQKGTRQTMNKAKRFAKQLASKVYQNKAHFKSQICYDKNLLAIISHKIVGHFGCIHKKFSNAQIGCIDPKLFYVPEIVITKIY